jgi:hypothetical protein
MKSVLLAIFALCFCLTAALSQNAPSHELKARAAASGRLTTIMGTVEQGTDKLRFVTDQRVWNVDNPQILEGHEGHYVHAKGYLYPDQNLIHITELKVPTARETMEAEIK